MQAFKPSIQQAMARELQDQGWPGLYSKKKKKLSHKIKNKNKMCN